MSHTHPPLVLEEGLSASGAGRRLLVARSTATRWGKIWRDEGRAEALAMGGDQRSHAMEAHASIVLGLVEETPDIFLHEIVAKLASQGISASTDMVRSLLARHGITRKKRVHDGKSGRGGQRDGLTHW
ncbi:hypothetical protein [Roseospira visakhapatnamensis]|uniref:Transposase n=1 Tax=Roseospira visakhapatnamensis TaxID=390880 RepID=A0A7W6WBQ8_9PROT|nr:hypothetical protein [Roseospira visakhapatnamensis]MBB4268264.1 transposase [Roseospira visakhapatnamensis]